MKKLFLGLLVVGSFSIACINESRAQPYTVSTIAGSPASPGSSDGTNGSAQFTAPTGLVLDSARNIYLADGNAIRRVSPSGSNWVTTTLAGEILQHGPTDGTNGLARFDDPQGLTADISGNLFVADTLNNAIRKVVPSGTNWVVTTIAGLAGRLNFGSLDGTNGAARFGGPNGIGVDYAGNLYVADSWSNTIRKITPIGTNWVVSTIAGLAGSSGSANGTNAIARFHSPSAVVFDGVGSLYVSDFGNNTIRKVTPSGTNWVVTTIAGMAGASGSRDGLGTAARFNLPQCLAVDNIQNLFVTDSGNLSLRKVTPTGLVSTVAGLAGVSGTIDGTGALARFGQPCGVAVDGSGTLFVADYLGYAIRQGSLAPILQYAANGRQLVLSWPLGLTGYVPQVSSTLTNRSWTNLSNAPVLSEQYYYLTNTIPPGVGFYRLRK